MSSKQSRERAATPSRGRKSFSVVNLFNVCSVRSQGKLFLSWLFTLFSLNPPNKEFRTTKALKARRENKFAAEGLNFVQQQKFPKHWKNFFLLLPPERR
jgi:hypothetical protein